MKVTLSDEGLITFEDGDSLNRNTLNRKRLVAVPETALAAGESLWVQFGDNIDYDAAASEILEPIMLEYAEEYGGYITLLPDAVLRKPGKWYMTLAVRLYAADGTTYQSQLTSEKTSFTVNDSYPLEDGGYASNATLQNLYNEAVAAKEAASASATAAQGYMEQAKEYAQKEYKLYDSFADLPEPGDSAFIYLVPQQGSEERDNYAEYLWISESGAYEFIGTVNDIDLSNYAQQNGTYPDMTVGNATNAKNDGERNSIYDSYLGWWNMGALKGNKTTSQDFDDYTETGCYEILGSEDSQAVNNPVSTSNPSSSDCNWYFLVFTRTGENFITQIAFSTREDNAVAIRSMSNAEWGSWRLISEEGSAPTADKVANALTFINANGGTKTYNGAAAQTIDLAPTVTTAYAEIGSNTRWWVNAKIVMERRGNRANIHIDFRLDLQNGSVGASDFDLISCAKLRTALGLNSFSCDTLKTRATVENLDADIYGDSASGIGAGLVGFIIEYNSSEDFFTIARIFQPPAVGPSFGAYMLSENYYTEAAVYHVDIWDAVVS